MEKKASGQFLGEIALSGKTITRASKSYQKFNKFGASSPVFIISAASAVTSSVALLLVASSKAVSFTEYKYLVKPLSLLSSTLGSLSDCIDDTFSWNSPIT